MTKVQLITELSEKLGQTKGNCDKFYRTFIRIVRDELTSTGKCELCDLGIFRVKTRAARVCKNPQNGETMQVPEKKVVKFAPCKDLRELIIKQ